MKVKLYSAILVLCFVIPSVSCFVWIKKQQKAIRREVKHAIISQTSKDAFVLLKFSKEETETKLKWKHSREFGYNDQMYDIVETIDKGDSVFYYCWWDHKETKLNKKLSKLLSYVLGHDSKNQDNKKKVSQFFKTFFVESSIKKDFGIISSKELSFKKIQINYKSRCVSPPYTPPKTI